MIRPPFPASFRELLRWFPDDEACLDDLVRSRWPEGFVFPHCGRPAYSRVRSTPSSSFQARVRTSTAAMMTANVEPESAIRSDGLRGYGAAAREGRRRTARAANQLIDARAMWK